MRRDPLPSWGTEVRAAFEAEAGGVLAPSLRGPPMTPGSPGVWPPPRWGKGILVQRLPGLSRAPAWDCPPVNGSESATRRVFGREELHATAG